MDKQKIIRSLVAICVIILLVTVASRVLFKSGETLDEYAEENPQIALATPSPTLEPDPSLSDGTSAEALKGSSADSKSSSKETDAQPSKVSNSNGTPLLSNGASIEGRYEYADGFYCEAVSSTLSSYEEYSSDKSMFIHVMYNDFSGNVKDGEMVCDAILASDILEIFYKLYDSGYKIEKIALLKDYGFDAAAAMDEDVSFTCGNEVCINPMYNPWVLFSAPVDSSGTSSDNSSDISFSDPSEVIRVESDCYSSILDDGRIVIPASGADYVDRAVAFAYRIDSSDLAYKLFTEHDFIWGGDSNADKEYCMFSK